MAPDPYQGRDHDGTFGHVGPSTNPYLLTALVYFVSYNLCLYFVEYFVPVLNVYYILCRAALPTKQKLQISVTG